MPRVDINKRDQIILSALRSKKMFEELFSSCVATGGNTSSGSSKVIRHTAPTYVWTMEPCKMVGILTKKRTLCIYSMYIYISHIFKTLLAKHRLPGVFTATIELGSSLAWASLLPAFGIERVP